jgi:hypothetical protein
MTKTIALVGLLLAVCCAGSASSLPSNIWHYGMNSKLCVINRAGLFLRYVNKTVAIVLPPGTTLQVHSPQGVILENKEWWKVTIVSLPATLPVWWHIFVPGGTPKAQAPTFDEDVYAAAGFAGMPLAEVGGVCDQQKYVSECDVHLALTSTFPWDLETRRKLQCMATLDTGLMERAVRLNFSRWGTASYGLWLLSDDMCSRDGAGGTCGVHCSELLALDGSVRCLALLRQRLGVEAFEQRLDSVVADLNCHKLDSTPCF